MESLNYYTELTDRELLSSIVGEKPATYLIGKYKGIPQIAQQSTRAIMKAPGIGIKKAKALRCALEISKRKEAHRPFRITDSASVAKYLQSKISDFSQEVFYVMFFNRNNELIGEEQLFVGGVSSTIIDTKVVYRSALEYNASAIIVSHNHPSGNLRPSMADLNITKQLKAAGEFLDIQVLDHIIVSYRGYYSFADEGMM